MDNNSNQNEEENNFKDNIYPNIDNSNNINNDQPEEQIIPI